MNTLNGYSKSTLTDNFILTAAGGHIPLGNASGNVPLSNGTVNTNLRSEYAQFLLGVTIDIEVAGDKETYYPVSIKFCARKELPNIITIWKDLGSKTAVYTGNHSNGTSSMLYRYECRNNGWDGNQTYFKTLVASYGYARLVAHTEISSKDYGLLIIWLRGGGTTYKISADYPLKYNATDHTKSDIRICYETTNIGSSSFPVDVSPKTTIENAGIYSLGYFGYGNFSGHATTADAATNATYATNIPVTQNTNTDAEWPIVWSNQNNTNSATANQLYKSYTQLTYNPSKQRISVNNLWSHNATLTLSGTSGVYIKYNNNDANSVVLGNGYFKPFGTSSGKLDLGYGNSRWKNIYATNLLNIVNTAGGTDLGMLVQGSQYTIGFIIGTGNTNRGIYDFTNSKWILQKADSTTYINDWTGIGSSTNPVYFTEGKPVACTYSLNKTVPSDAVFTDTSYASYVSYKLPATEGWYRIAQSTSYVLNCMGLFQIAGTLSGYHTLFTMSAGTSYNTKGATNLTILSTHHYKQKALSKVRIVYKTDSWSGQYAYLEVYNAGDLAQNLQVKMIDGMGWTLNTASSEGSIPSGYTSKETDLENETISSSYFKGNLDGTYINKLTGYSKATSAADITTTDTLNSALGKLEYKADTAYDWIINVTATDTDEYINKWDEITGFLDSVKEGTDILDEFVTRKTEQTITGNKTFSDEVYLKFSDATLKFYETAGSYGGQYGNETMCIQTCFDQQDPKTSNYVTNYPFRTALALQPRGGTVGVGTTTPKQTLDVLGNMQISSKGSSKAPKLVIHEYYDGSNDWISEIVSDYWGQNVCSKSGFTHGLYIKLGRNQTFSNLNILDADKNPIARISKGLGHWFDGDLTVTGNIIGTASNSNKLGGIDAAKYVTSDFTTDPKTIGKLPYVVSGDNVLRDSNLNYFTYLIPDGGAKNTFTLIAKLTNWKVGTNSSYALIGTIYGHRAGNAARTGVHTIVAQAVSYSTLTTQKLYVDNNSQFVLQPYIVSYTKTDENGNRETANYLALKKFGSGDPIHFIGFTKDLLPLNEWIDLVCPDSNSLPTDMTIVASPSLNAIVLTTSQIYDGNATRTILHSGNYTTWINATNFPGLNKTGTVTSIKVGSISYSPTSGVVNLPAYPTSLKSPNAIKFKNTAGTKVSYDGSAAVDLTGGVNYATGATNLLLHKGLSSGVYTTVKAVKDQLKVEFGNIKECVGSFINIPHQTITNWSNESFAYNSGGTYTAIKLSGGYSGNKYGQWLLSAFGDERLYYVGLYNGEWTTLRKIAITSDIPTTLKNPHALTFATGNFTTKTYDGSSAVTVKVPTKTSHLTNDTGYLTNTSNLITITKTISVSNEWNDTGIYLDSATFTDGAGSYVVQVSISTGYLWTGVLSVLLSTSVTSTASNEILMHGGGFDTSQASHLYLRTIGEKESGKFKIQIARHSNSTKTYTFKFKKII